MSLSRRSLLSRLAAALGVVAVGRATTAAADLPEAITRTRTAPVVDPNAPDRTLWYRDDAPYMENVLQIPDPETRIYSRGTWVPIKDALAAWDVDLLRTREAGRAS